MLNSPPAATASPKEPYLKPSQTRTCNVALPPTVTPSKANIGLTPAGTTHVPGKRVPGGRKLKARPAWPAVQIEAPRSAPGKYQSPATKLTPVNGTPGGDPTANRYTLRSASVGKVMPPLRKSTKPWPKELHVPSTRKKRNSDLFISTARIEW